MKALVTGSSGLIGSRICHMLLKKGWEVNGMDIRHIPQEGVEAFQCSITDPSAVRRAVKDCDVVFHQAAASSSPMFYPDPSEGVRVNVDGSMTVFQVALEMGVRKIVAASTSSIYGNTAVPSAEDQVLVAPNMYAASKQAMESAGLTFSEVTGMPIVFLRYFSVYGLGERRKGNIANMLSQFLWTALELDGKGKKPVIYGDGKQTRDLVFAEDIAEANFLATRKNVKQGVYNVGSAKETSLNDMIEIISEVTGRKLAAKYVKNPIKNYIYRTLADTSKTEKAMGFRAKTSVKQGVKAMTDELTAAA